MLPSDLLIFSPPSATTIPEWAQCRAKAQPAAIAWTRSFSWWGKARSWPPPWRSNPSPSRSRAMTTHSVCQPGRPGTPRRVPAGLTGLGRLPEGEIDRRTLTGLLPHLHPGADPETLDGLAGQQAVTGHALRREIDAVTSDIGVPGGDQLLDQGDHVDDVGGGVGRRRSAVRPRDGPWSPTTPARIRRPLLRRVRPSTSARAMILSSMSVTLETKRTSRPDQVRYRRRTSHATLKRPWPRWGSSYTVGPHTYMDTCPGWRRSSGVVTPNAVSCSCSTPVR